MLILGIGRRDDEPGAQAGREVAAEICLQALYSVFLQMSRKTAGILAILYRSGEEISFRRHAVFSSEDFFRRKE